MRIGVHDPSGGGLGVALGLADLGHEVGYDGPQGLFARGAAHFTVAHAELARHTFGAGCGAIDPVACDLVVIVDAFADFLGPLQPYLAADRRGLADPPSFLLLYPQRLQRALDLASAGTPVVVFDASDRQGPRETMFEGNAGWTLLARECPLGVEGPWRPLPFLYNNALLWLERMHPRSAWRLAPADRAYRVDWSFCGTVDHPRYGGSRRRALDELTARRADLRGEVRCDLSFDAVLRQLQSSRLGLDLPGAGELCFRLHECLALGVPVWKPRPGGIEMAPGLEAVVGDDTEHLLRLSPAAVRATYEAHYAPRVCAERLLAAVGAVTAVTLA